jgi:hypothetical protein
MLTVYFAVVGVLGALAVGAVKARSESLDLPRLAAAGAALVTAVFFIFEIACEQYLQHFGRHLCVLEEDLGIPGLRNRPRHFKLVQIATCLLFLASLLFWLRLAIWG